MTLEIQVLAWDRHTHVAGDKSTNIIPILLFFITGSPTIFVYFEHLSIPNTNDGPTKVRIRQVSAYVILSCAHFALFHFKTLDDL
jgi:hypothetical protein